MLETITTGRGLMLLSLSNTLEIVNPEIFSPAFYYSLLNLDTLSLFVPQHCNRDCDSDTHPCSTAFGRLRHESLKGKAWDLSHRTGPQEWQLALIAFLSRGLHTP